MVLRTQHCDRKNNLYGTTVVFRVDMTIMCHQLPQVRMSVSRFTLLRNVTSELRNYPHPKLPTPLPLTWWVYHLHYISSTLCHVSHTHVYMYFSLVPRPSGLPRFCSLVCIIHGSGRAAKNREGLGAPIDISRE